MKLAAPIFAAAISLAISNQQVKAPEIYKRGAKLIYDRIEVGVEPVRVQRCQTFGTVWWDGKCFRPDRIPRSN